MFWQLSIYFFRFSGYTIMLPANTNTFCISIHYGNYFLVVMFRLFTFNINISFVSFKSISLLVVLCLNICALFSLCSLLLDYSHNSILSFAIVLWVHFPAAIVSSSSYRVRSVYRWCITVYLLIVCATTFVLSFFYFYVVSKLHNILWIFCLK